MCSAPAADSLISGLFGIHKTLLSGICCCSWQVGAHCFAAVCCTFAKVSKSCRGRRSVKKYFHPFHCYCNVSNPQQVQTSTRFSTLWHHLLSFCHSVQPKASWTCNLNFLMQILHILNDETDILLGSSFILITIWKSFQLVCCLLYAELELTTSQGS